MLHPRWLTAPLCCAALVASAPPALAAQTTYDSRAAFTAAFAGQTASNTLDGFAVPDPPGYLAPLTGITYGTITTGTIADPAAVPGALPTQFLAAAVFGSGLSWQVAYGGVTRLTFATPVRGFGADFFDLGTVSDVAFRLFLGGHLVGSSTVPQSTEGYNAFYGLSTGGVFDAVQIESAAGEAFEMDDPTVAGTASTVPEPGAAALLASGLATLGVCAARRRRPGTRDA